MSSPKRFDVAIIGGGIVGCATALALSGRPGTSVLVLEAEDRLAAHQTGNNSGVIHSGLYYKPGSLKATLCVEGREALYRFCEEHGIECERCGKVVVATRSEELPALEALFARGQTNGLEGLRRLGPEEIRELEPHCTGIAGLFVPQTGIVDYTGVTVTYGRLVQEAGGEVHTRARVRAVRRQDRALVIESEAGVFEARNLVNCAGLQSDRVARLCGVTPGLQIVPFRGEYYEIVPEKHHLVKNLIYPVPDQRYPFLGVHFTRRVLGGVEAGPNAVLSFKREGYSRFSVDLRDTLTFGTYSGFWRMAAHHWRMGLGEFYRSFSTSAFVHALQALVPEISEADVRRAGAGVRAQALERDGSLADDFRIVEAEHMLHVLNAPSPAATASLAIGRTIAERAEKSFGLA
jgi:(S)-2-hydroxyglutarate dehydrogenase